jgi:hypothetical protein
MGTAASSTSATTLFLARCGDGRYFLVPDHAPLVLGGGGAGVAAAGGVRVYKIVGTLQLSPHAVLEKAAVQTLLRDNAVQVENVTASLSARDVEIIRERSARWARPDESDTESSDFDLNNIKWRKYA